jgi:hypothetical protein
MGDAGIDINAYGRIVWRIISVPFDARRDKNICKYVTIQVGYWRDRKYAEK